MNEIVQQSLTDLAAMARRFIDAIMKAVKQTFEPLMRWLTSKETKRIVARLKKKTTLPVHRHKISAKRVQIYQRKTGICSPRDLLDMKIAAFYQRKMRVSNCN